MRPYRLPTTLLIFLLTFSKAQLIASVSGKTVSHTLDVESGNGDTVNGLYLRIEWDRTVCIQDTGAGMRLPNNDGETSVGVIITCFAEAEYLACVNVLDPVK